MVKITGSAKTYYIDAGDKTDYLFWVDETIEQDMAFYEVDYGERSKMTYSGDPDSHRAVLSDAIQRLVNRGVFPDHITEFPLKELHSTLP
ncbi:MAG: hypothetical protein LC723_12920 [Actinobacteria bacterium]|nr:hypothetical protein [Actinomycetota bacterium]